MRKKVLIAILFLCVALLVVASVILYQEYQYAQGIAYYDSLRSR